MIYVEGPEEAMDWMSEGTMFVEGFPEGLATALRGSAGLTLYCGEAADLARRDGKASYRDKEGKVMINFEGRDLQVPGPKAFRRLFGRSSLAR